MEQQERTPCLENLSSLRNIFRNITQESKDQILGNCTTLENEDKRVITQLVREEKITQQQADAIIAERKRAIRLLLRSSVITTFVRLNGLFKIFDEVESQMLSELKNGEK